MSGHNKWSKVKHKKAAEDAKKSKIFSMHARLITLEAKKSGGNVSSPNLKNAIDRARAVNMPAENIERAIKRALGSDAATLEEVVYEAYGPGGTAFIIQGVTDNKNRTSAEIKHLLSEHETSLSSPGAALWAFEKKGDGYAPREFLELSDEAKEKTEALLEELEGHDDVRAVFTNARL